MRLGHAGIQRNAATEEEKRVTPPRKPEHKPVILRRRTAASLLTQVQEDPQKITKWRQDLLKAIRCENLPKFQRLLNEKPKGTDLDFGYEKVVLPYKITPLVVVIDGKRHPDMVRSLLAAGASPWYGEMRTDLVALAEARYPSRDEPYTIRGI